MKICSYLMMFFYAYKTQNIALFITANNEWVIFAHSFELQIYLRLCVV